MGKTFAVDMAKRLYDRSKHFAGFFFAEWTVGEGSSEVFLSVLHERENQIDVRELAAAAR